MKGRKAVNEEILIGCVTTTIVLPSSVCVSQYTRPYIIYIVKATLYDTSVRDTRRRIIEQRSPRAGNLARHEKKKTPLLVHLSIPANQSRKCSHLSCIAVILM